MSSGSVMGRWRMTVPAAEKMTTRMINTTPVLIELRVFQVLLTAERNDAAMTFVFLSPRQCTYCANPSRVRQALYSKEVDAEYWAIVGPAIEA